MSKVPLVVDGSIARPLATNEVLQIPGVSYRAFLPGHTLEPLDTVGPSGTTWSKVVAPNAVGVVLSTTEDTVLIGLHGVHSLPSHGLEVNQTYYASSTTAGLLLDSDVGETFSQPILTVIDSNSIYINNYRAASTPFPIPVYESFQLLDLVENSTQTLFTVPENFSFLFKDLRISIDTVEGLTEIGALSLSYLDTTTKYLVDNEPLALYQDSLDNSTFWCFSSAISGAKVPELSTLELSISGLDALGLLVNVVLEGYLE